MHPWSWCLSWVSLKLEMPATHDAGVSENHSPPERVWILKLESLGCHEFVTGKVMALIAAPRGFVRSCGYSL